MEETLIQTHQALDIPRTRFQEFSEFWKKYRLGELILKLESGVSVNSTDAPVISAEELGVLKTSCVFSGSFFPQENKKIVEADFRRAKLNPTKGSILISRMNTPALVGESGLINSDHPNLFIPDRLWMTTINSKVCDAKFLSLMLSSKKIMQRISNIATGTSGSMKNISKPNFLSLEVFAPSLPEQQKIASFLSSIDEKIQLLTRKKELLEQYKKGVMQQLFSGKLRFKDEQGNDYPEWEKKKLGEIATFKKGKGVSKADIAAGGANPCIRYGELYTTYTEVVEEVISATNIPRGELVFSEANDVIIPASGETPIDIATASCVLKKGVALSGDINIIRAEIDGIFLSYYLNSRKRREIAKLAQGNAVVHLYSSQLQTLTIDVPCKDEQRKIAKILRSIDSKIAFLKTQINFTKTFKKGLLQQMFV